MEQTLTAALLPEIDLYCERETAAWLDEPLGLASNGAFLVAAWISARTGARPHTASVLWLIALLAAIGIGSALFHATATRWALLMDVIPIQLFILSALILLMRTQLSLSIRLIAGLVIVFVGLSALLPSHWLNGSAGYLPAWVALATITWLSQQGNARRWLLRATLLFPVSLTFRTLDLPVCDALPFGTHFLWHLCNAAVLWMVIEAVKISSCSASQPEKLHTQIPFTHNLQNNPHPVERKHS